MFVSAWLLGVGWAAAVWLLAKADDDDEAHREAWLSTLPGASNPHS
jgi:hypothetical protein